MRTQEDGSLWKRQCKMLSMFVCCLINEATSQAFSETSPTTLYQCINNECQVLPNALEQSSDVVAYTADDCRYFCRARPEEHYYDNRLLQNVGTNNISSSSGVVASFIPQHAGTCAKCDVNVNVTYDIAANLKAVYGIDVAQFTNPACVPQININVTYPFQWISNGPAVCSLNGKPVACTRDSNSSWTAINVTKPGVMEMINSKQNNFTIANIRSPFTILPNDGHSIKMTVHGTGCQNSNQEFIASPDTLNFNAGNGINASSFTSINISANNPVIGQSGEVYISAISGGMLTSSMNLRLYGYKSQTISAFGDIKKASLIATSTNKQYALKTSFSDDFGLNLELPSSMTDVIDYGEPFNITLYNVQNPNDRSSAMKSVNLMASFQNQVFINTSNGSYFDILPGKYTSAVNTLDIISASLFGLCLAFSLLIVYWHGLAFSCSTLWTDLVALCTVCSFACACAAYVIWMIKPSKLFVFIYAAQYFFNTIMIISLCFHWMTVLSLKLFKKITFKSPAVYAFALTNGLIAAAIIITTNEFCSKLECVYDNNVLVYNSTVDSAQYPAASGWIVRKSIQHCDMNMYYLSLACGFIVYTVLLMILGGMVMIKGRSLMLLEDPNDQRMRKSLTIFYIIIATTCVLYISAQIIYIAQYLTNTDSQVSENIWYIFIVWLPQGLPPLLLLFLQWNPTTEDVKPDENLIPTLESTEKDAYTNLSLSPHSQSSPEVNYSRLKKDYPGRMENGTLFNDEITNKLHLVVRLKLPIGCNRSCFITLEYCSVKFPFQSQMQHSLQELTAKTVWKCVGETERVKANPLAAPDQSTNGCSYISSRQNSSCLSMPFVAVLSVPVVGPASNTLLRFVLHTSLDSRQLNNISSLSNTEESKSFESSISSNSISNRDNSVFTTYQPLAEFVTTPQAVMDAAANGQPLVVFINEEHTCPLLSEPNEITKIEINQLLKSANTKTALCIQTVMMPGEMVQLKDETSTNGANNHKNIGNIIRFFQYDSEEGGGGLVVEDLKESQYSNNIPRQLLEHVAMARQDQVEAARMELASFVSLKKNKKEHGFYGTLIGQIQDEGDFNIIKEWLENRLKKRKDYVNMVRKNIQFLVNRDKHKQYFKASIEKKSEDLRFVPINLHVEDLLIGPTNAFMNEEKRRRSKSVSTYEITTVGAMSAHVYKFNKGGLLSMQQKLKKLQAKNSTQAQPNQFNLKSSNITSNANIVRTWSEEQRQIDDLQWDIKIRMDVCFSQALAALVASFVRKIEIALQNPDVQKGEDILRQISTLGYLYQVESLLSTHGKEIGMLEDMAEAVAKLSCVAFTVQDVKDKPTGRFSFRVSRKKDSVEEPSVVKVQIIEKPNFQMDQSGIQYIVNVQVLCGDIALPDRLASGGEVTVCPVIFTQGINEMQTIANNTERAKTELQDMININNLKPLKIYCDKYCRLAVALPPINHQPEKPYGLRKQLSQSTMRLSEDKVNQEFHSLELCIVEAAQSLVKTKRPDILTRASDLCRELGGGRVTVCKSAKDRTAMSVTLEQVRILHRHHDLPKYRVPSTVNVMRTHGVRIENALKNTGKRQFAFNKLQRSLLPEDYRCPESVSGAGNIS